MQQVSCYNCKSGRSTFYACENGFNLVKCDLCGLLFVNPRPRDEDILAAHQCGLHRGHKPLHTTGQFDPAKVQQYLAALRDIFPDASVLSGKSWLDIGCGHGELLHALQAFNGGTIHAKGHEPNVRKRESARRRGQDVDWLDLREHTGRFDIVSFLNVYSHLPDPPAMIAEWRRLLKPKGELLLETGDTAGFDSRDHLRPFSLPDHLSFASEQIVTGILKRAGFEIVSVRKCPGLERTFPRLARELIKVFWPHKTSVFRHLLNCRLYARTDMFIRARRTD